VLARKRAGRKQKKQRCELIHWARQWTASRKALNRLQALKQQQQQYMASSKPMAAAAEQQEQQPDASAAAEGAGQQQHMISCRRHAMHKPQQQPASRAMEQQMLETLPDPYAGMTAKQRRLHELKQKMNQARKANENATIAERKRMRVSVEADMQRCWVAGSDQQ